MGAQNRPRAQNVVAGESHTGCDAGWTFSTNIFPESAKLISLKRNVPALGAEKLVGMQARAKVFQALFTCLMWGWTI